MLNDGDSIIGVDPGTAASGWGIVQFTLRGPRYHDAGVVRTASNEPLERRLLALYNGLSEVISRYRPVVAAVETPFFGVNANSALTLGHARGALLLAIAQAGIPVVAYSPREVKMAVVGGGGASKQQVAFMVSRILERPSFPTTETSRPALLSTLPADAADALAIALCHCLRYRRYVTK